MREGEREGEGDPFPAGNKRKEKSTEWRLFSGLFSVAAHCRLGTQPEDGVLPG